MNSLFRLFAASLLGLYWWMAASVSHEHSTTADEIFHVTAGYAYWMFDDYRLQPENGNLPQRWAALPLLAQDLRLPSREQAAWRNADMAEIGHQFFYESGNDLPRLLASARAMIALLGAGCGLLVFLWAQSLFGRAGGLIALGLFAFCPLLLAHGGLATSDMAAALGFLAATLTGWRLLHRVTFGRIALAGLTWGALALAKFSAPLFVLVLGIMGFTRLARPAPLPLRLGSRQFRLRAGQRAAVLAAAIGAAGLIAVAAVWVGYGLHFHGTRGPGGYNFSWVDFQGSLATQLAGWARRWHLLPEAWLQGFAYTLHFAQGRPAYFLGEYGTTGWRLFFPVGFAVKTTLPALALILCSAVVLAGQAKRHLAYRLAPLLALAAVYGAFAVTSHLNIGVRHLLPLYPVLYILAGGLALAFHRRWIMVATVALLVGHGAASLACRPSYLAYFNPLLGGPSAAYRYFVDSSLDWGQDLPGLKRWLDAHAAGEKIYLSYFGSGSPAHSGIRATRIADGYFDLRSRELLPDMTGGIYCISATLFQQVYTLVRHGWSAEHERRYAALTQWLDAWRSGRDTLPRDEAIIRLQTLEHLRFGRLCAFLQRREPDANVGNSILIYHLSDADIARALTGPPPEWPPALDQP